jgi:uncharacterized membrane protein YeaQ/YmgE (transglycosylase-associated protein family)
MSEQTKAIVAWIVIGLIAGFVASLIVGGGGGIIGWLIAGLIGSVVGGFLARQLNLKLNTGNLFLDQVIIAIIGAIIVIIIARIIT